MTVVYAVRTTVQGPHEREWRRWQDEEHIPQLLALPGYRDVQRFRDLDRPATFLNLWRIDHRGAQEGGRYRAASLTPWFDRIRPFYDVDVAFSAAPDGAPPDQVGGLLVDRWDGSVSLADIERLLRVGTAAGHVVRMPALVEGGVPAPRSAPSTVVLTYLPEAPGPVTAPPGIERRRYRPLTAG